MKVGQKEPREAYIMFLDLVRDAGYTRSWITITLLSFSLFSNIFLLLFTEVFWPYIASQVVS